MGGAVGRSISVELHRRLTVRSPEGDTRATRPSFGPGTGSVPRSNTEVLNISRAGPCNV